MDNKTIAKVLRESLNKSTETVDVWNKVNGFNVVIGTKDVVNGGRLKDRLEALISILETTEE